MKLANFTAAQILAISINRPEDLFSAQDKVSEERRSLAAIWHPDRSKDAAAAKVLAHINALADAAKKKTSWNSAGVLELRGVDGKLKRMRYRREHAFELGNMIYGDGIIAFILNKDFADLFQSAKKSINGLTYATPDMEKEVSRYMPSIVSDFETIDGKRVMVMKKTRDLFLLGDVVTVFGGRIDPKHVAWILNSVYNICSYLQFAGISHNAISADAIFVSPKFHSSVLAGGWWYATEMGQRLNALPSLTHRLAPPSAIREKKADASLDPTMIKVLGRHLLGDVSGMNLKALGVPAPMIEFLRAPSGSRAYEEYAAWGKALKASFGDRRFVEMNISESDIFKN